MGITAKEANDHCSADTRELLARWKKELDGKHLEQVAGVLGRASILALRQLGFSGEDAADTLAEMVAGVYLDVETKH